MGILSSPLQSWQTLLSAADGRRRIQIYTSVSTSDPFAALLLYLLWCAARLYRDMPAPGLSDVQGLEGQDYPGKAQQGKKILGKAWQVQPREYNFQKLSSDFHLPHTHTSTPHTHKNTHSHKHTQRHIHTQAYTDIHTHTHRYIHKTHIHRHIDIHRHSIHTHMHSHTQTQTYTLMDSHTQTQRHTHTETSIHTSTYPNSHTHRQAHTQTDI